MWCRLNKWEERINNNNNYNNNNSDRPPLNPINMNCFRYFFFVSYSRNFRFWNINLFVLSSVHINSFETAIDVYFFCNHVLFWHSQIWHFHYEYFSFFFLAGINHITSAIPEMSKKKEQKQLFTHKIKKEFFEKNWQIQMNQHGLTTNVIGIWFLWISLETDFPTYKNGLQMFIDLLTY